MFNKVQGVLGQPAPGNATVEVIVLNTKSTVQREQQARTDNPTIRIIMIFTRDFTQLGHTPRCDGCTALIFHRPPQDHSEECRKRVLEHLIAVCDRRIQEHADNINQRFGIIMENQLAERATEEGEEQRKIHRTEA